MLKKFMFLLLVVFSCNVKSSESLHDHLVVTTNALDGIGSEESNITNEKFECTAGSELQSKPKVAKKKAPKKRRHRSKNAKSIESSFESKIKIMFKNSDKKSPEELLKCFLGIISENIKQKTLYLSDAEIKEKAEEYIERDDILHSYYWRIRSSIPGLY